MSDEDIVAQSVCVIDRPNLSEEFGTVYDPRMGCATSDSICATCNEGVWKCPGHFGHIELNVPIVLFYKQCVQMLKVFCFKCHRLVVTADELSLNKLCGFDRVVDYAAKQTMCARCRNPKPEIRYNISDCLITATYKFKSAKASQAMTPVVIKTIFDDVPNEDVALLGVDVSRFHPRNLVLTKFLVLPTCCRPRVITSSVSSDDDLTLFLVDIIKNNAALKKYAASKNTESYEKCVLAIKMKTLAYCDNSKGKVTHNTNHKPMTGIKERITKKSGIVRQNLMGKRCDRTARTVVGPDPTLKMDEVAVPREIAKSLTVTEYVTPLTIDSLTRIVNDGEAATIVRVNSGIRINLAHALVSRGTQLHHGDKIERERADGSEEIIVVTNCKMPLTERDRLTPYGKKERTAIKLPTKNRISLTIGDKVERFLRDGDPVLINRQPTLHRNSMQGMRVRVKSGKTMRLNLAIVSGFNMDFDGDEGNLFDEETYESRAELLYLSNAKYNILSAQMNKSEMVIVQDSLLGAYKMTVKEIYLSKLNFFSLLMRTSAIERYPDLEARLGRVRELRGERDIGVYSTHALFAFIIPDDFFFEWPALTVTEGVPIKGYFDKSILKSSPTSIIRLLCVEYGREVAARFVDDVQFLTNGYLETAPFSVTIHDCLVDPKKKREIKDVVHRYFLEAEAVASSTDDPRVLESRINCSLNKAKDIGLRIAKDAMDPTNNIIDTVTSGSKGDYFNIAQITGLLGQQNVNGHRVLPQVDNNTRTLIHYPPVITDTKRKFESGGFVASSFMGGLNPKEMFFHAMTGREGMINTATGTATSGYIQRSCVKLNEDIKIAYDFTVRDANSNIYQFVYGDHGFDPCKVSFGKRGVASPINIARTARRYEADGKRPLLSMTEEEIDDVVEACRWNRQIPAVVFDNVWSRHERYLRRELSAVRVAKSNGRNFARDVITAYNASRICPGECVGIISAQSIGERQTQTNLNTFHTAGKLRENTTSRFEEILSMTKNLNCKSTTIFFREKYATIDDARKDVAASGGIVGLRLKDICRKPLRVLTRTTADEISLTYELNPKIIYGYSLYPSRVAETLRAAVSLPTSVASSLSSKTIKTSFGSTTITISFQYASSLRQSRESLFYTATASTDDPKADDESDAESDDSESDDSESEEAVAAEEEQEDVAADEEEEESEIEESAAADEADTEEADEADTEEEFSRRDSLSILGAEKLREDLAVEEALKICVESTYVSGIQGIKNIYYDHDGVEWYAVLDGGNLKRILAHPLIDGKRVTTNDIWDLYECLGIYEVRRSLLREIKSIVGPDVNDCHVRLLVDKMTAKGKPTSMTRYSMRVNEVGALSKATFEECIDILINAAVRTETEDNVGVSASIISGNQPRIGTGMMGLKLNLDQVLGVTAV